MRRAKQRVFVLGFDGMDPTLARKWMDEGKLPNLKRLSEQGTFAKLETTQPSESPVAWASFATGVNPGKHNIYDFLVRDFQTYLPDLAGVKKRAAGVQVGVPAREAAEGHLDARRHVVLDARRQGRRQERRPHGAHDLAHRTRSSTARCWAACPSPDIRGTLGTFSYWATDLSSFEEGNTEFGGYLKRLLFEGGVAQPLLKGPDNPILKQEERELQAKQKAGALSDADEKRAGGAGHEQGRRHPDHGEVDGRLRTRGDRRPGHAARSQGGRLERLGARSPSSSTRS